MELDKIQKFLLMLIVFISIVFIYEAAASAQVQPAVLSNPDPAEVDELEINLSSIAVEQPAQNNTELIDYGQPLELPSEFFENETNETENQAELIENSSSNISLENYTTNETNQSNQTNETIPEPDPEPEPIPEHDLGIAKLYTKNTTENPLKIQVKVQVKNYGNSTENQLHLRGTIGNETREYGPYEKEIKISNTRTYTWTLPELGEYNITFEILNYTSLSEDANLSNNIKAITVYLQANGNTN